MGFFSDDMVGMLGVYEAETSELVGTIEGIASRAEQTNAFATEDVAELFRCAHTIKGSSAMMGLDTLSNLTHTFEDLFDLLRKDPSLAEGNVPEFLDRLYAFTDYAKDELARMGEDDYEPADASALVADLERERARIAPAHASPNAAATTPVTPNDSGQGSSGAPAGAGTTIKVTFKPDVPMVNARAMVIVRQLGKKVDLVSSAPEDLTSANAADEIVANGLLLTVGAADVDAAKGVLAKSTFIRRIDVLEDARATATAPNKPAQQEHGASPTADKFITLRWDSVHELQDLAGEFLLHAQHLKSLYDDVGGNGELRGAMSHTTRLVEELVYRINAMAMVSVSAMVPQLSRMVRDMRRASGKEISFEVHGGNIDIDRNLYNSISEPLLHIIRNAVDHGIETPEERLAAGKEARGKVVLSVENLGARVAFRVSDDGRGINTSKVLAKAAAKGLLTKPVDQYTHDEALMLVMSAGLSTSNEVTQYSGRGVGLDVVQTVIRDFNGRVELQSDVGKGTSLTLFMPVSVTTVQSLGFRIGPSIFHMPLFNLEKIYAADDAKDLLEHYVYVTGVDEYGEHYEESMLFLHQKRQIPLLNMHALLDYEGEDAFYLVCHSMEDEFVIGVDEVIGEFGCANKAIPLCFDLSWQYACAIRNVTIMEDGVVGFALNAPLLAGKAHGREAQGMLDEAELAGATESFEFEDASKDAIPEQAFVFLLGTTYYAVPVERVVRLVAMPFCAPAPHPLPCLMGLMNYRNRAIAVFDLARSAQVDKPSPYVLVVANEEGDHEGLAITSALGVRNMRDAVLADEQPPPRVLTGNLRTAALLKLGLKELPVTLLTRCPQNACPIIPHA